MGSMRVSSCRCWVSVLGVGVGVGCRCRCWVSVLGVGVGCRCWVSVLGVGVGCRCWVSVLGVGVGCRCWVSVLSVDVWCAPSYISECDVHSVAFRSAVYCSICSLVMFMVDASGDHVVEVYSSIGLVMVCDEYRFLLFFPCGRGECYEYL